MYKEFFAIIIHTNSKTIVIKNIR